MLPIAIEPASSKLAKDLALLPPRAALGATMLYHGYSKLKGEAPQQAGAMFEQIGLRPGKPLAVATGIAEVFAGASALLGIFTRPAALAILVTQAVAVYKVHLKNGFDITKGGYEYNLALMGIAAAMLLAGPGRISLHEEFECLAEGRGAKKLFRKARPNPLLKALKLIK
jgi:putative oxidoreductase